MTNKSSERKARPAKRKPSDGPPEVWSKSKKKRMRKLLAMQKKATTKENIKIETRPKPPSDDINASNATAGASSLQQAFRARLTGSRFRILNEELYTTTSSAAYKKFAANPELYEQYHTGFRHQVEHWPVNPIDVMVTGLRSLAHNNNNNNNVDKPIVVADFGCGDAELAKQLLQVKIQKKYPFRVHSFDLVAANDLVTACDMAQVPLKRASVDVAIFCLSLMGTNLADFIREAHRVLNERGQLKIAEVRSRFETRDGKHDDLKEFIAVLAELGFQCVKTDKSNKMFVVLELEKNGKKPKKDLAFAAKPCIYKRR